MRVFIKLALIAALTVSSVVFAQDGKPTAKPRPQTTPNSDEYLTWSADQSVNIGKGWRLNGRVGGALDLRVIHTEHSYNYKLRATLMTPEVIRATARLEQLRLHLTDQQTRALVEEAEQGNSFVALVE